MPAAKKTTAKTTTKSEPKAADNEAAKTPAPPEPEADKTVDIRRAALARRRRGR